MIELQVTLFQKENRFKPISTLIKVESIEEYKKNPTFYKMQAIQKICNQRYISGKELQEMGYTVIKIRNYTLWKELNKKKKGSTPKNKE